MGNDEVAGDAPSVADGGAGADVVQPMAEESEEEESEEAESEEEEGQQMQEEGQQMEEEGQQPEGQEAIGLDVMVVVAGEEQEQRMEVGGQVEEDGLQEGLVEQREQEEQEEEQAAAELESSEGRKRQEVGTAVRGACKRGLRVEVQGGEPQSESAHGS